MKRMLILLLALLVVLSGCGKEEKEPEKAAVEKKETATAAPTVTSVPTEAPTEVPTEAPTEAPTATPTATPEPTATPVPTATPTAVPTSTPLPPTFSIGDYTYEVKEDGTLRITGCVSGLATLNIPTKINGIPVTSIGSNVAENSKKTLTNVRIPDSVTEIEKDAFRGLGKLNAVTLPSSLRIIGPGAFAENTNLNTLVIPEGVTTIEAEAFKQHNLKELTLPVSLTSIADDAFQTTRYSGNFVVTVTPGSYARQWCRDHGITYFFGPSDFDYTPAGDWQAFIYRYHHPDGLDLYRINGKRSVDIVIPEMINDYAIVGIYHEAFASTHITSVVIPEGVTWIGDSAFSRCKYLTSVEMPSTIEKIGSYAFRECKMTTIYLGPNISEIGKNAFMDCNATLIVEPGSYAEQYAINNGLSYKHPE